MMNLYKNTAGEVFGYSDEDLINLEAQGIDPIVDYELTLATIDDIPLPKPIPIDELAKQQLNATDKLHSGVYQRHMTESQLTEFNEWQDALYDVAYNGGPVLPDTPEFINNIGVL